MFYCFITILSTIFCNSLICKSFVIEIFYFQTVPGTKHHRFMINLTFYAVPSLFRHQKDSGSWSIHKGENFFNESCILVRICIIDQATISSLVVTSFFQLHFFITFSLHCSRKLNHYLKICQFMHQLCSPNYLVVYVRSTWHPDF